MPTGVMLDDIKLPLVQDVRTWEDWAWVVRKAAAQVLGEIGDVRAVEPLIVALKNKHEDLRKTAAEALGKIGDARAVEPLRVALKDEDRDVRKAAAKALGKIGDARAVRAGGEDAVGRDGD